MIQNFYIQIICENKLDVYITRKNHKRVLMSDDIWKSKLECCKIEQSDGKIKCKRHTGLIGIIRGHAK